MSTATRLDCDQARFANGKVLAYLVTLDLHVNDLARTHVHSVQLKHFFGNVQTDNLQTVHRTNDLACTHSSITIHDGSSVVFVKTWVYHILGTLMPYPSEDQP